MLYLCACNVKAGHVASLKCWNLEPVNMSAYFPHNTDLLKQEHIIKIWSLTSTLLVIEIPAHDKGQTCFYAW